MTGGSFELLAVGLERQLDSLQARVLARLRAKGCPPGRRGDLKRIDSFARESLKVQLRSFRQDLVPMSSAGTDVSGPLAGIADLEPLLIACRLCQVALWEAWFALVEDTHQIASGERRELLSRGSDFFFAYADLLSEHLIEDYRAQLRCSGRQLPFRAVKELLEGDPLAADSLDFDFDRHHLGMIAWGEDAAGAAVHLARSLERPLLSFTLPERAVGCWAWASAERPLSSAEQRVVAAFDPPGARVALGLEGFGEAGFRTTHRQALRVRRLAASRPGQPLLRYEDLVVEALVSENEDDIGSFLDHELRGIDDDSAASQRIRETLEAYFGAEYNAASAAAALGVHQQTVANRLRAAEKRLGHSVGGRRVELEVALRLRRIRHGL